MAKGHRATASAKAWPQTQVCAPGKGQCFHVTSCLSQQAEDRRCSWSGPHRGLGSAGTACLLSEASHVSPHPSLSSSSSLGHPPLFAQDALSTLGHFSGNHCTSRPKPPLSAPRGLGPWLSRHCSSAPTRPPASGALTTSSAAADLSCPRGPCLGVGAVDPQAWWDL